METQQETPMERPSTPKPSAQPPLLSPVSPSNMRSSSFIKVARVLGYPISFYKRKFKAGGMNGSIFSLITATLGSGTISLPYLSAVNGIYLASLLIIFGAIISNFGSMLLVKCAEKVGSDKYEEFANYGLNRKWAHFTGWGNLTTMLGFVISYIVFVKTLIPRILEMGLGSHENVPDLLNDGKWKGQIIWATIYGVLVLFPLSIPRQIGVLRFNSLIGVLSSIYLVLCLIFMFFLDDQFVPSVQQSYDESVKFKVTYQGIVMANSFIVYAFMYQPNIPIVYRELNDRNYKRMKKVVNRGSGGVVVLYICASIFGYLGVVSHPKALDILMDDQNILLIPYENWAMKVGIMLLLFAVFAATPVGVLPAKDTYEELVYPKTGMSPRSNLYVTIGMGLVCYGFAIAIPGIGDAIIILGGTANPLIGFILPIIFYLKIEDNIPTYKKVIGWLVMAYVIAVSVIGLILFILEKLGYDT